MKHQCQWCPLVGNMEVHWKGSWQGPGKCEVYDLGASEWPFRFVNPLHHILKNAKPLMWRGDTCRSIWHLFVRGATAHSGARAFITHAGSHGLFEGLCHAVPMLMMPLGGDQPDNAERLASRNAGLVLDITTISTESLLQGLNAVINDTRSGGQKVTYLTKFLRSLLMMIKVKTE